MKLGEAIVMGQSKSIEIEDSTEYTIAGVQSYGKGVVNRRTELGKNLKMKKYQVIEPNYLMWCKVDTKNGAFGITKPEHAGSLASTNMALAKINTEKFNPYFLERLFTFDFFHGYITHLSSGSTNRKYLTPKQLSELVQLPNLSKEEQDDFIKLVDRIENLEISTELTLQLDLVKQLRQAFLREAMQGKLMVNGELSMVNEGETGAELLEKIKAEKERLIKEKKIKKQKPLPPITEEEIPFKIPENWVWCRLGNITSLLGDGLHGTPSYSKDGEYYFVNGNNLVDGQIVFKDNTKRVSKDEYEKHKKDLGTTTVLVSINGTLGNVAVYNGEKIILGKSACYFNLLSGINKWFIKRFVDSEYFLEYAVFVARQTTIKNVSLQSMRLMLIPLPSLSEQQRIVAKLDELMAYCDDLEASIKESQQQNELLLQQVLREALEPKGEEVEKV